MSASAPALAADSKCESPNRDIALITCATKRICGECKGAIPRKVSNAFRKVSKRMYAPKFIEFKSQDILTGIFPPDRKVVISLDDKLIPELVRFEDAVELQGVRISDLYLGLNAKREIAPLDFSEKIDWSVRISDVSPTAIWTTPEKNYITQFVTQKNFDLCGSTFRPGTDVDIRDAITVVIKSVKSSQKSAPASTCTVSYSGEKCEINCEP